MCSEECFKYTKIHLYSIRYICIQSKLFLFNEKYFHSNTGEHYLKSYSGYFLSFMNMQLFM